MIGLVLGETKLGKVIINKLKFLKKRFIILDISKKGIFKKNKDSFHLSIGQIGKALSILKKNGCKKIIFAGKIDKPNLSKIKFDIRGLYYLPKISKEIKRGDAFVLKAIIKIFNKEGFRVMPSTFFNSELLLKKGNYTKIKPNFSDKQDILKARNIVTDLRKKRFGQAVVVRNKFVIAIEDDQGTDIMLNRAQILLKKFYPKKRRDGILLKFPKKNQDLRIDLPTVGIKTFKKCARIGLKGVVLKSNQNIFLDRPKCISLADKKKMFISAI